MKPIDAAIADPISNTNWLLPLKASSPYTKKTLKKSINTNAAIGIKA